MDVDNPAGRLQEILSAFRRVDPNTSIRHALRGLFGNAVVDESELAAGVAAVMALALETRRSVESLDGEDPFVYLAHFEQVEQAVTGLLQLGRPVSTVLAEIEQTGWHSLASCSSLLHRRRPQPTLDGPAQQRLVGLVAQLIEQVRTADDLDAQTKEFVLRHLVAIRRRLEEVRLFGLAGVEHALDAAAGALGRNPGMLARLAASKTARTFASVIVAVDLALNLAANAVALMPGGDAPVAPRNSPIVLEIAQRCDVSSAPLPAGSTRPTVGGTADRSR